MAYMTINDLIRKLNNSVMKDREINKEAIIQFSCVCKPGDRDYPEGTIVFGTVESNATPEIAKETYHELTIYPDHISQLN